MSPRNTWLWVTLALGLFAFIFFFERHGRNPESGPPRVLPELRASQVTSISVLVELRPGGRVEIRAERTNGGWQLTRPLPYPGDAAAIENLLRTLEQLRVQASIGAAALRGHTNSDEEFGFEVPQASLRILQAGYRHQLLVGARSAPGDQVFLQVVGGPGVLVADAAMLVHLPASANAWRDPAFVTPARTPFDQVFVTNGSAVFGLRRDGDRLWRLSHPLPARADANAVEAALRSLERLRVTRFVTDDPKADADSFGFQPPELSLAFAQGTNVAMQFQFGKSPTNDPGQVFARRLGWPSVVTVPREPLAAWRADHSSFRDRHLLALTRPVVALEVRAGGERFTLQRQPDEGWRVLPLDLPADTELVEELLVALSRLEVVNVEGDIVTRPGLARYGLATPACQFEVRAAPARDETATHTVLAVLQFGASQDDKLYARRTDEDSVYAVRAAEVQRLPNRAFQFRERRLWSFAVAQVTNVTIRQNGKVRQLLRQGTNSWSLAPGSQGLINDLGVEESVRELGGLSAVAWVATGEPDLARWGFQPEALEVTVGLASGDALRVRFGGTAPSQLAYAATSLAGQVWVFECPPAISELARAYLTIPANAP